MALRDAGRVGNSLADRAARSVGTALWIPDYNVRAERMGWFPSAPQLEQNPLSIAAKATAAGKELKDYVAATPEFRRTHAILRRSGQGLHIIRLDRKIDGVELLELVATRMVSADYLGESVRRRAVAQYIARLVSDAEVTGVALEGSEAQRVD